LGVTLELIKMKNKTALCHQAWKDLFTGSVKAITLLIVILFCGFCESAFAQDLLILKSGKELKVNIIEENETIVKYREFENPTGPLYQVAKDKVASIKYKKGQPQQSVRQEAAAPAATVPALQETEYQQLTVKRRYVMLDGKALPNKAVKTLMEDNPEALQNYVSGKKLCTASNAFAYGVMVTSFVFARIANSKETDEERIKAGTTGLVIDGVFIVSAIVMASVGKSRIRHSVELYNSSLNKPVTYKLDFGLQENGIGLALRF
jgi:hypothetical protein